MLAGGGRQEAMCICMASDPGLAPPGATSARSSPPPTLMATTLSLRSTHSVARALRKPAVSLQRRPISGATQPARSSAANVVYASIFVLSTGLFAVYYSDCRAALHKYVVTPVIRHTLDAESGHKLAVRVLSSGLAPRDPLPDDEVLKTEVCSILHFCAVPVCELAADMGRRDVKSRWTRRRFRQTC